MSVRAEVEELVRWISDVSAKHEPKPTPQPPYRENWELVAGNLGTASENLRKARDAITAVNSQSFLAESALDLEREAEGLKLRARMLSRRAPHRTPELVAAREELAKTKEQLKKARKELDEIKSVGRKAPAPHKEPRGERSAADLVGSVSGTLETAQENLFEDIDHPDAASKAFGQELDLLAERTLSLHQQCEHLS